MFNLADLPKTQTEFVKRMREATTLAINFVPTDENRKALKQVTDFQYSIAEVYAAQVDKAMAMFAPAKAA
jgi:hypothetical protein